MALGRIHHLNCISMCPLGGKLMDGRSKGLSSKLSCHCLLIETNDGLVLVDTGFGLHDVAHPAQRLSKFFLRLNRPLLREEDTAIRQIEHLGFDPNDVRHIVLTHLDFDHAGGLDDFPDAKIHLLAEEREVAFAQRTRLDRMRFRPSQWTENEGRWLTYRTDGGERWYGFDCVSELEGLPPEILLVPLAGHTLGHCGVAIDRPGGWLLHAGDAYFFRQEMDTAQPRCSPGLRAYQRMMEQDRRMRLHNQERLRALVQAHSDEVRVFCAHDYTEFEELRLHGPGHQIELREPGSHEHAPYAPI